MHPITASGEMYFPVCSFCCFWFASGLIRPLILVVSRARTSTLEIFSALRSWLFARLCVWLLRLRSFFVFFSRSADLNSPPSVSMPSRSVMYCCEWTSSTLLQNTDQIWRERLLYSYLRNSPLSRFCSFLTREIHRFFLFLDLREIEQNEFFNFKKEKNWSFICKRLRDRLFSFPAAYFRVEAMRL